MIGDGIAPQFFQINSRTGLIKTTASLETDMSEQYTVRVILFDVVIQQKIYLLFYKKTFTVMDKPQTKYESFSVK